MEMVYDSDERNGKKYYENGKLMFDKYKGERFYRNGMLDYKRIDGKATYYDEHGIGNKNRLFKTTKELYF